MASDVSPEGSPRAEEAERRLHPTSLLFSFARTFRALLLPALAALLSKSEAVWAAVGLVLGVPAIGVALFRHFTLRWSLRPDELLVREGLFFRSERHVPYSRIQDVDLVQGVFHRLLRVAEVRVQTAAGAEPEAVLRVLGLREVEILRAAVRKEGRGAAAKQHPAEFAPASEALVPGIPAERLVVLGLVLHRGLAVVGGGFALLWEADLVEPLVERLPLGRWLTGLSEQPGGAVLALLLFLTGAVVLFAALSIAWSVVRFGGYRMERAGDLLHVRCGLLTRISASVPVARIQSLTVEETWMHRLFGCASLAVRTAGGHVGESDPSALLRHRFVPILPATEVPALVSAVLPHVRLESPPWRPLSPGAPRRAGRRAVLLLLLLAAPLVGVSIAFFHGRAALWSLAILVPLGVALATVAALSARRTRWARMPWGFVFQRGVLNRRTTLLPADRIQTVRTQESPFDRRHAHVTLTLDAAGGVLHTSEVKARYLDASEARALHDDLAAAAAATEYRTERVPVEHARNA